RASSPYGRILSSISIRAGCTDRDPAHQRTTGRMQWAARRPQERIFRMIDRFIKHTLLLVVLSVSMAGAMLLPAHAVVEIDVNRGTIEPLPIAITDFLSGDSLGAEVSAVIAADLQRSGLFAPISKQ